MKRIIALLLPILLTALSLLPLTALANDKKTVYVAGNPNFKNIEYYDDEKNEYCGVIPDLLKQAQKHSSYNFVYINKNKNDNRKELCKNSQVELVSSVTSEEKMPNTADIAYSFKYNNGKEDITVSIVFTNVADDNMKSDIISAFSLVTDKDVASIAITHMQGDKLSESSLIIALSVVSSILAIALFAFVIYRIKMRNKAAKARQLQALERIETQEKSQLEQDIKNAMERDEIKIYIQWSVGAKSKNIIGGEILTRWQHPKKGFISAAEYINQLENENCIVSYDLYILEKTCQILEKRKKQGKKNIFLSCNMSRQTFTVSDFTDIVNGIITKYDFDPSLLVIEMTEDMLFADKKYVFNNIAFLKNHNIKLALDDFGTGYTSFTDLKAYDFDILKLDKKSLDMVATNDVDKKLLYQFVALGHTLGMTVLAEGIETVEQAKIAMNANVDIIQGYYFYHPMPLYESEKII